MSGLESILARIRKEAEENAAAYLAEADGEVEKIKEAAQKKADELKDQFEKETEKETGEIAQRYQSAADMQKKQAFLSAKQGMIGGCVEKAYNAILSMDDTSYFAMLKKMLSEKLEAKEGTLYLSGKDRGRMPASFLTEVAALAKEKGGTLTVSEEEKDLDGGFVLSYGGIDENCSIRALFEEKADTLSDTVSKLLFS